jgi:uncharacterized membrane protein YphA (DoxX/SURF4 family)
VNVVLWGVASVLAGMFLLAGTMKSTQPRENLIRQLPWVEDVPQPLVRLIGVAEFAAALGLILPAAFDVVPILTPLAATGLAVMMVLAAGLHVRRKEPQAIALNAVLLICAVVVAWGRFGPYSF